MSNALRMPEASMCFILSAIQALFTFCQWSVVSCQLIGLEAGLTADVPEPGDKS